MNKPKRAGTAATRPALSFCFRQSEALKPAILHNHKMKNPAKYIFICHFRNHPYDLFSVVHICLLSKTARLSPHMGELSFP